MSDDTLSKGGTPQETGRLRVVVEMDSWVSSLAGATGPLEFTETLPPGASIRQALEKISSRHPRLARALWDQRGSGGLGPNLEVIVNDAVLGVRRELDSPLRENDRIILTGQYVGG
ncbi:MAG: MoaD/ThiS family protein [Deltaproteobacteria bacterium]|nr:MoaD/ThiS family protein [Deltaproteobacteria bacterium]